MTNSSSRKSPQMPAADDTQGERSAYRQGMLRAAEMVKAIGKDWRDFGMPENGAAADYLERAIRAEAGEPGDQK